MASTAPGKSRSPNYPSIGLREAIHRLRPVYDKQTQYPTTRDVIATLMGYKSLNGASATVVSALGKFGLIEGHGDALRVSDLGRDLVLHQKGDTEYSMAVRRAADLPAFFRELREQYPGSLPSEQSLRVSLIKRGFNPKAIDGAVRAFRETEEFVASEVGVDGESSDQEVAAASDSAHQHTGREDGAGARRMPDSGLRAITLPYSATEWASLQAAFPLSEAAWTQMMAVLTAMKPALVVSVAPVRDELVRPSQD